MTCKTIVKVSSYHHNIQIRICIWTFTCCAFPKHYWRRCCWWCHKNRSGVHHVWAVKETVCPPNEEWETEPSFVYCLLCDELIYFCHHLWGDFWFVLVAESVVKVAATDAVEWYVKRAAQVRTSVFLNFAVKARMPHQSKRQCDFGQFISQDVIRVGLPQEIVNSSSSEYHQCIAYGIYMWECIITTNLIAWR